MTEAPQAAHEAAPQAILFRKIAEVMGEVEHVKKRGRNDFHKYDYATEAELTEAVRSKLAARNVAIIPGLDSIEERTSPKTVVTTAHMTYTFCCGETGATFTTRWGGQGADPVDKGLYKAFTGATKYFLMKTFLIPTGDDPEGDTATDRRQAAPAPEPLTDERAQELLRTIDALSADVIRLGLKGVSSGTVEGWKHAVLHDHDRMQDLIEHLRSLLPAEALPPDAEAHLDAIAAEVHPDQDALDVTGGAA